MPDVSPPAPSDATSRPLKVFFVCTSLGNSRRGIESFFRECFDAMHDYPGLQAELYKGGGEETRDEYRLWCLPKFNWPARLLGKLVHRNGYVIEQLTFLPALLRRIRAKRPDLIFYSDVNLAMRLMNRRESLGFKLIYSNGAPAKPPYTGTNHVQQVTPTYYDEAIAAGEPPAKHSLVPYGIAVPAADPPVDAAAKRALREQLGLPTDRPIVLSVGWISASLKRMDYLIEEIALMPVPRPFVVLLGEIDETSPPILALAKEKLGEGNYAIRSVPYEQVGQYYRAADVFALASLKEGFGRVYLEALIAGLPCVVNDHAVTRYVLGEEGTFADLTRRGELARHVAAVLAVPTDAAALAKRRDHVRRKFGWDALRPTYMKMFLDAVGAR